MTNSAPVAPAAGAHPLDGRAEEWARRVVAVLESAERTALAKALNIEVNRPSKPRPLVVVAGEDKRGKSSLVNALLQRPGISPTGVEVVTATPITFFRGVPERAFVMHYGDTERHPTTIEEAQSLASVQGNPGNEHNINGVSIGIDNVLLDRMLIVDSPGVGGLDSGHGALTLQRLKAADALIFVLEAGAQIRGEELKFLQSASARIERVIIVLTKVDAYRGWQQIMQDNLAILRERAPRLADCPVLPVSSTLALRGLSAASELASDLRRESGFEELERVLIEQVAGQVGVLRAANILRAGISPLADLQRREEAHLRALASPHEARQTVQELRDRQVGINRQRMEWPQVMQTELRRLVLDRSEELARGILELRTRYTERLKELKPTEHDTLPGEFVADLTAVAAEVNEWTQERIISLVSKLIGDDSETEMIAGSLRQIADAAFAEELASISLGEVAFDATEKISIVQSYSSGHSMVSLLAIGGMTLISPPIALGLGVVAGGLMAFTKFRHTKKSNFETEFRTWMMDQIQRVQLTVTNTFQRAQIDLEEAIRKTLTALFSERDAEIREGIADCERAIQEDQAPREAERKRTNAALVDIRALKQEGVELLAQVKG